MSNFEDKKVNIRADLANLYEKKCLDLQGLPSLNKIVNIIFEKYLEGRIVELNNGNFVSVKKIAEHFKCTNDEALNIALNQVEFDLKDTPKTRITLDRSEKVKVKKTKLGGINPVANY